MVEKYIEAHAANHTIWELEGSVGERVRARARSSWWPWVAVTLPGYGQQ